MITKFTLIVILVSNATYNADTGHVYVQQGLSEERCRAIGTNLAATWHAVGFRETRAQFRCVPE